MKKTISIILTAAMLATSAAAFADTTTNTRNYTTGGYQMNQSSDMSQMPGGFGGPMGGQMPGGNMNSQNSNSQMPGQMPGGDMNSQNSNAQMPGQMQQGQMPGSFGGQTTESSDSTSSERPELPEGATEGELPELPDGVEAPDQNSGNAPQGGMPGQMNGGMPGQMNGGMPGQMNGNMAPDMVDFDAMAENNVISAETLEKIKAYMEASKPDDLPEISSDAANQNGMPAMNGQAPQMNGQAPDASGQAPQMNGETPEMHDLLAELLEQGIITQDEYDALAAARTEAQTTENTTEDSDEVING